MFRKAVTTTTASKITATVNALASAGDPATAELMRRWFNQTFEGFVIEQVTDGKRRILGYRLTSDLYGVDLRETEVKPPVARKKAAPRANVEEPDSPAPANGRYAGWYEKLDAILPPMIVTEDERVV